MPGGNKRGVFNTRERAVSDDLNRLQRFIADDIAQRARFTLSAVASHDQYGGPLLSSGVVSDPLEMHILEGVMGLPQAGTSNVHVSGGVAWMVDPDGVAGSSDPNPANPDDNEFKYARTAGVSDASLTHSANAGPGRRIDVLECQRTEIVRETDSRDVFDVSTGQFTPVSVDKVSSGDLTFRLREGTAGAGFPGTVAGWTPIMVASVPAAFTSVDDITYWDVRPLVSDRKFQPFRKVESHPPYARYQAWIEESIAGTASELTGIVETSFGGYRAGGTLKHTHPGGGDFNLINVLDPATSDGVPLTANSQFFVWAIFPFGLPRWARYNEAGGRVPSTFNGIVVVSLFPPAGFSIVGPSVPLPAPTSTGLGPATTTDGVLLFAGRTDPAAGPVEVNPHTGHGGVIRFAALNGAPLAAPPFTGSGEERYVATPNVEYPASAKAIYVTFITTYSGMVAGTDAGYTPQAHVFDPNETLATATPIQVDSGAQTVPFVIPSTGAGTLIYTARIPLRQEWGPLALPALTAQQFGVDWNPGGGLTAVSVAPSGTITGWEL